MIKNHNNLSEEQSLSLESSAVINWQIPADMYSRVEWTELKEAGWWWFLLFTPQKFNYSGGGICWESQLILPGFPQSKTPSGGEKLHEVHGSPGAGHMQLHDL